MSREIVLVAGGAGYIGSHTVVELLNADYDVVVVDNLYNASSTAIERVEKIAGRSILEFFKVDLRDEMNLEKVFEKHKISAVIHFAGLKAVGESVQKPLDYYSCNVGGSMTLFRVMNKFNCNKLVFSSSSCVYGELNPVPFVETMETCGNNPYGQTKFFIERILQDLAKAPDSKWQVLLLRYFNPIGAHPSGLIGDDQKVPNNLLPYIEQVAIGKREALTVFGGDYDTPDGTCVRDYLHVVDCALGHLAALKCLSVGCEAVNLGTSRGISVKELINAFETVNDMKIKWAIGDRRAGDIPASYADCSKATQLLNWKAERSLEDMVSSAWKWRSLNPDGFN